MDPVKVLIIEDDEDIRINIEAVLTENGYNVAAACDGKEGIKKAESYLPDLIICDIMMPGLSGYAVLQNLLQRKNTKSIPFIYLTARTDREDVRKGMQLGADDYLFKPFKIDEILNAVESRLKKVKIFKSSAVENNNGEENKKYDGNDKLYVQSLGKPLLITIKNIVYIKAENQYTLVGMSNKKTFLVRRSVTEWMKILSGNKFIRIHRSAAVNIDCIEKIEKKEHSAFLVYIKEIEEPFVVSRRYSSKLRKI